MRRKLTRQDCTLNPILTLLGFTKAYQLKPITQEQMMESKAPTLKAFMNEVERDVEYVFYSWKGHKIPIKFSAKS